jgi:hypothetical protein
LSPKTLMPAVQVVILYPNLPITDQKCFLRIYVIGQMQEKSETTVVAAFTDVVLNP